MNINEIDFDKVIGIIKEAAELFKNVDAAHHIRVKGKADFVTEVDTSVQEKIHSELNRLYPEIQFMGEEQNNSGIDFKKSVWILDPVDGTTNLIYNYKASCISLGLAHGGEMSAGIVYNPYLNELFFARKGKGAYLNGKQIHVSGAPALSESLVSVGTAPYYKEYGEALFESIKEIYQKSLDIRRIGSAAIDLCCIACGRTDAYFEPRLQPWDYSAGMLLVEEAGGHVTDFMGNTPRLDCPQAILATNGQVHEELREIVRTLQKPAL